MTNLKDKAIVSSPAAISKNGLVGTKKAGPIKVISFMGLDVAKKILDVGFFIGIPISFFATTILIPTVWFPVPTPPIVGLEFLSLASCVVSIVASFGLIQDYRYESGSKVIAILRDVIEFLKASQISIFRKTYAWYKDAEQRANKE